VIIYYFSVSYQVKYSRPTTKVITWNWRF